MVWELDFEHLIVLGMADIGFKSSSSIIILCMVSEDNHVGFLTVGYVPFSIFLILWKIYTEVRAGHNNVKTISNE